MAVPASQTSSDLSLECFRLNEQLQQLTTTVTVTSDVITSHGANRAGDPYKLLDFANSRKNAAMRQLQSIMTNFQDVHASAYQKLSNLREMAKRKRSVFQFASSQLKSATLEFQSDVKRTFNDNRVTASQEVVNELNARSRALQARIQAVKDLSHDTELTFCAAEKFYERFVSHVHEVMDMIDEARQSIHSLEMLEAATAAGLLLALAIMRPRI